MRIVAVPVACTYTVLFHALGFPILGVPLAHLKST